MNILPYAFLFKGELYERLLNLITLGIKLYERLFFKKVVDGVTQNEREDNVTNC